MRREWKLLLTAVAVLAALTAWAARSWFAPAKETGYRFVLAWGKTEVDPGVKTGTDGNREQIFPGQSSGSVRAILLLG